MGFSRQEYWSGVPLPSPDSSFGTYQRVASPESLGCAHCRPSVRGGFKETRDCKEIKILFQPVLPALGARISYLNWRSEPHEISAEFVFCCPGLQHNGPLVSWKTSYLSVGGPPTPLKTLGAIHNYNIIVHVLSVYTFTHETTQICA